MKSLSDRSVKEHAKDLGITNVMIIEAQTDNDIVELIRLCDPSIPIQSETEFSEFWNKAKSHIDAFISRSKHPSHTLPDTNDKNTSKTEFACRGLTG